MIRYSPIFLPDGKNIDWVFPDGYYSMIPSIPLASDNSMHRGGQMTSFRCLIKGILRCEKSTPRRSEAEQKLIQTKPKRADLVGFLSV